MARVCVPVCVRQIDELHDAMNTAADVADIVELRADCLADADPGRLSQIAATSGRRMVVTLRSPEQGGHSAIDHEARRRFWADLKSLPTNSFIDLELDLVEEFSRNQFTKKLPVEWRQVICSHHDFDRVPDEIMM